MDSRCKMILAPMVRIGTLPTRLLALHYGSDLVYTPETVALKLIQCRREFNPINGIVDYSVVNSNNRQLVLRLHTSEKPKLILQIGASDPDSALRAALLVQQDVSGIDLNCGCPKRFSVHAGMGAALLKKPDLLCSILRNLSNNQPLPVSCKVRILSDLGDTLKLIQQIGETGIKSLCVHARTPAQRYDTPADWRIVAEIRKVLPAHISLYLNGDVTDRSDMERAISQTGCDGVMLARAAQHNLSVFSDCPEDLHSVSEKYLKLAGQYDNSLSNTKYCLIQSWADCTPRTEAVKDLLRKLYIARSMSDLYAALDLVEPKVVVPVLQDVDHLEDLEMGYTRIQQENLLRIKCL